MTVPWDRIIDLCRVVQDVAQTLHKQYDFPGKSYVSYHATVSNRGLYLLHPRPELPGNARPGGNFCKDGTRDTIGHRRSWWVDQPSPPNRQAARGLHRRDLRCDDTGSDTHHQTPPPPRKHLRYNATTSFSANRTPTKTDTDLMFGHRQPA